MNLIPKDPALEEEIHQLESRLLALRARLASPSSTPPNLTQTHPEGISPPPPPQPLPLPPLPSHTLLHLTDSALPLGTFAFSSGLESYLAHHAPPATPTSLPSFLHLSLLSLSTTTLPFLSAAYENPQQLEALDDELDAQTLCPVSRRASIAQGRALLTLWARALSSEHAESAASAALASLARALKVLVEEGEVAWVHGHFPLVYAAVCRAAGLRREEMVYTFLFGHAKGVVSAGIRTGLVGPYAAQGVLGGRLLRAEIEGCMGRIGMGGMGVDGGEGERGGDGGGKGRLWGERGRREAAQSVPMLDCWVGRHELLYSRIFNS